MNEIHSGDQEPDFTTPSQLRDDLTVKLLVHLFNDFCLAEHIDEAMQSRVSLFGFMTWLHRNMILWDPDDKCEQAGVPRPIWGYVDDLVHSPQGPIQIQMVWPRICLSNKPLPRHKLRNMHLVVLVTWEDGRILPVSLNTPDNMATPHGLTDALCASILPQQLKSVVDHLMAMGLDNLHDNSAGDFGGENIFNVIMGALMHKIVPFIQPQYHDYIKKQVELIRGILYPSIPLRVQESLARDRQCQVDQEVRGGFSN